MNLLDIPLSQFQWWRKFRRGTWFLVHIDSPVHATVWLKVPINSTSSTYKEPIWLGVLKVENWHKC